MKCRPLQSITYNERSSEMLMRVNAYASRNVIVNEEREVIVQADVLSSLRKTTEFPSLLYIHDRLLYCKQCGQDSCSQVSCVGHRCTGNDTLLIVC